MSLAIGDKSNFDRLPDEVILRIFKYLDLRDLFNIAPVCWRFQQITEDVNLWKYIKISDSCNSRLCRHTINLVLQKPISKLEISYFGEVSTEIYCPKGNLHSAVIKTVKNKYLTHLKFLGHYHCLKYVMMDIVNMLKNSPSIKALTCHLFQHESYSIILAAKDFVEVLKIPYCNCSDKTTFTKIMENCQNLKELHMRIQSHHWCTPLAVDVVPKHLCKLTLIYFDYKFISLIDDDVIVSKFPNLVDLNLPYCQITVKSLERIAEGLKSLERLVLGCEENLKSDFRELKKLKNLKYLTVGINQMVSEDLRASIEVSHSVLCLI